MKRDVFSAIADPTRRAILGLLAVEAMTPNSLSEHFSSSRQAISKHIKVLSDSGLIWQEQSGREIYYHIHPKKLKEVDGWLQPFRDLWEKRFSQLDTVLQNPKNQ